MDKEKHSSLSGRSLSDEVETALKNLHQIDDLIDANKLYFFSTPEDIEEGKELVSRPCLEATRLHYW